MAEIIIKNKKSNQIQDMFNSIAFKYDLLNNLMTFGFHDKWKSQLVKLAIEENNQANNALDICTGTGDIAICLKELSKNIKVLCLDTSENMLALAKEKLEKRNLSDITLINDDFNNVSLNKSFDIITIGFGLRNLENKEGALNKIYNLLNPNGIFACIDLGHPSSKLLEKVYFIYFYNVIPIIGKIFANNMPAYLYLTESLKTWYRQEELKKLILSSGFKECYYKNLFGGVIAIHIAKKQ